MSENFFDRPVEPVEPSRALKARIMSEIARTPQLPPTDDPEVAGKASDSGGQPAAEPAGDREDAATPAEDRAKRRWFRRPAIALTAVAAAAALILGGGVVANVISDYRFVEEQAEQLAAITAAADTERATIAVGDASATLIWSVEITTAALIVENMAAAPSDKTYQLWYIGETGARSAGTFTVSPQGEGWRVLDGSMAAGDTVGVTVEPRGGSEQPTSEPIMRIES